MASLGSAAENLQNENPTVKMLEQRAPSPGWLIALGVVDIIAGMLAILMPVLSSMVFEVFIGAFLLVSGLVEIFQAYKGAGFSGRTSSLLSGLLQAVVGGALLVFVQTGMALITLTLGLIFVCVGGIRLYNAIKGQKVNRMWLVISGVAAFLLGGIILFAYPQSALWALGLLLGVELISMGLGLLMWAGVIKRNENLSTN